MDTDARRLDGVTERVIGAAYKVANELGHGFLEKVYENALAHELRNGSLKAEQQKPVHVYYDGVIVGEYFADLLVEAEVLVELKAVKALDEIHMAQCLNYLKATGLKVCLLINFGSPKSRTEANRPPFLTGPTQTHRRASASIGGSFSSQGSMDGRTVEGRPVFDCRHPVAAEDRNRRWTPMHADGCEAEGGLHHAGHLAQAGRVHCHRR